MYNEQKTKMLHALHSLGEHNYKNHTFIPFAIKLHAPCAIMPVRWDYNFKWHLNHTCIIEHHHHSRYLGKEWRRGKKSSTAMETFS
jgi:hypothetical protein